MTISNDGATLMKKLEIVHPAAKVLVDISLSQDAEVRCLSLPGCVGLPDQRILLLQVLHLPLVLLLRRAGGGSAGGRRDDVGRAAGRRISEGR